MASDNTVSIIWKNDKDATNCGLAYSTVKAKDNAEDIWAPVDIENGFTVSLDVSAETKTYTWSVSGRTHETPYTFRVVGYVPSDAPATCDESESDDPATSDESESAPVTVKAYSTPVATQQSIPLGAVLAVWIIVIGTLAVTASYLFENQFKVLLSVLRSKWK
jgi:hypothetical protein